MERSKWASPYVFFFLFFPFFPQAKYNWDFYTVPQKHMDGRRLHQPRGRALGGSSSLNAMAYVSLGGYGVGKAGTQQMMG